MKRIYLMVLFTFIFLIAIQDVEASTSYSVTPAFLEVHTRDEKRQSITIINNSDEELALTYQLLPFTQNAQKPTQMRFLPLDSTYTQLFSKITLESADDQTIVVPPKTRNNIAFNIKADQILPRTYTFVILFSPVLAEAEADITRSLIQPNIAIPVILTTSKDIKGSLDLLSFDIPQFQFNAPVPITVTMKNVSSPATPVRGYVLIKNVRGQEIERIELHKQYIFHGITRTLTSNNQDGIMWKPRFALGIYNAELHLQTPTQIITHNRIFLVIPQWLIIFFMGFSFVLAGIYLRVRKYW